MDKSSNKIWHHLVAQWEEVKLSLSRMRAAAEVRPDDGRRIFKEETYPPAGVIGFHLNPVVFRLPERADDFDTSLFVVVQGTLRFDRAAYEANQTLRTHKFSTEAAYFRLNKSALLKHVYGAHYDFSESEPGHPFFHAQMKSFVDFAKHAIEYYGLEVKVEDDVAGVLKTVRLPCAQMDVFSFFLQVFADHLLYKGSGAEEKDAFEDLLKKSDFLQGAGFQVPQLNTKRARECFRAVHWYPT